MPVILDDTILTEIAGVGDYSAFATVDELTAGITELAAAHPGLARVSRIGTSTLGEPIAGLTIGADQSAAGARHAVVFGLPHPNEPIGGLTALHLAHRLCQEDALRTDLGLIWHIVPCIDPDGTRLNENWFAGPFTRTHYFRHFYRPAGNEQVEWTFPFQYKKAYFDRVPSETQALMRLIDETEPDLMVSLHNSETGGVYYYLSTDLPQLYPVLQAIPEQLGLSLHRGEPESPEIQRRADGIFAEMRSDRGYDYRVSRGMDVSVTSAGASSAEYAARYGTTTLICELPYWTDATAGDDTPTVTGYADTLRVQAAGIREFAELTWSVLETVLPEMASNSPFLRASRAFIPGMRTLPDALEQRAAEPESDRPATVAEVASCAEVVRSFRLRFGGMLVRALDGEIGIGNGTPIIRQQRTLLAAAYQQWCAEAEQAGTDEALPIRTLVATQYAAILATARELAARVTG